MNLSASRLSFIALLALVVFIAGYVAMDKSPAFGGTGPTVMQSGNPQGIGPGQGNRLGGPHGPPPSPNFPTAPVGPNLGPGPYVYVIGTNVVFGGFGVHKWTGSGWNPLPGGATDITVDSDGLPWAVNVSHEIFHFNGADWVKAPGGAMDIAACKGKIYIIGTNTVYGGYGIYRWNYSGWDSVQGGGVRIAMDSSGNPWVVNSTNEIYKMVNNQWQKMPGGATDIGAGGNEVWVVGTNPAYGGYGLYKFKGNNWQAMPGAGIRVDVDSRGNPWVVNVSGDIFRWNGSTFDKLPGAAKDIGAE